MIFPGIGLVTLREAVALTGCTGACAAGTRLAEAATGESVRLASAGAAAVAFSTFVGLSSDEIFHLVLHGRGRRLREKRVPGWCRRRGSKPFYKAMTNRKSCVKKKPFVKRDGRNGSLEATA